MFESLQEAWKMLSNCGFLSSGRFRSFFLYTKEPLEELMYGSMIKRPWFIALGASPIYVVMMPMFSFALIGLALVDMYELVKAEEKNLDLWLNAIIGSVCAALATISITLLEVTLLTSTVFIITPWFFLSSVVLFSGNALFQTGLNCWGAHQSPPGSQQRLNKIQSAINWAFIFSSITAVIGCLLFVILFPTLCVPAGTTFAVATVAFTTTSLLWRMTPSGIKLRIKESLGLEIMPSKDYGKYHVDKNNTVILVARQRKAKQDSKLGWCYTAKTDPNGHCTLRGKERPYCAHPGQNE